MQRRKPAATAREGFALLISLIALAILAVLVTDLHETTGMGFSASMAARDQLRAEYLAKSGINLTRMLIGQERNLRQIANMFYQAVFQRPAPQLPVWRYANAMLEPFANFDGAKTSMSSAGFDMQTTENLGQTGGTFEIVAAAENGKISLNDPRLSDLNQGRLNVALPLYSLMGGAVSPNKYDPLFSKVDEKGHITTRMDVISSLIDWWDPDEQRTTFDPAVRAITTSGAEDLDYYRSRPDPYIIKNAPFDTLEEMRLVRGIDDDFWATFIQTDDEEDPGERQVTIYGGGRINPNEAPPGVLLARVCTFVEFQTQLLCNDPTGLEPMKFVQLQQMARSLGGNIPLFSRAGDFVDFITGKPTGLYGKLSTLLTGMGMGATLLFTPLVIPDASGSGTNNPTLNNSNNATNTSNNSTLAQSMRRMFATSARIITIESTGTVGHSKRKIRTVINTDDKWIPPPPNTGKMPPLGIFSYYRID